MISEDRRLRQRAFYYSRIYADPKAKDTMYVLNTGFYSSTDGGKTLPHAAARRTATITTCGSIPTNPLRMVDSNDGGANVSHQRRPDLDRPGTIATAQLYHVATTRDIPYHVCGAQQDNSTMCVSSAAGAEAAAGAAARPPYAVGGGESGYIAPHPTNPNIFYAGSQGALLTRFDRRTRIHARHPGVSAVLLRRMPPAR